MKKHILDFKMNANPFGPPRWLKRYLAVSLDDMIDYPDYKNIEVNRAISGFLGLNNENVAVANGSLEAIFNIVRMVNSANPVVIAPTYWGYGAALDAHKIKYNKIILREEKSFEFDLEEIEKAAKDSTLMFICNPNNPTGTYIKKKYILKIVKDNPQCHFFIDEAHLILKDVYEKETLAHYVEKIDNLTIIYSTSKIYNVGGLRTGIIISNKNLIKRFKEIQIPYSTTTITQKAFVRMLRDKKFFDYTKNNLDKVVKGFIVDLKRILWLKVFETNAHFVLCKILARNLTSINLANRLMKDGFGIRECRTSYPELEGEWVRITSNNGQNNRKFIKKLESYKYTINN